MGSGEVTFWDFIREKQNSAQTHLCVGLDPILEELPSSMVGKREAVLSFLKDIVDATWDLACCFKPQMAHFCAHSLEKELEQLIDYIHDKAPGTPVLLDGKRGDIGSTAQMYAKEIFNRYKADGVTLNPYMGWDSLEAFANYRDKGIFVICRTSNPSAGDLQNLTVGVQPGGQPLPLYQWVAQRVLVDWNVFSNMGLVVGATALEELGRIRCLFPEAWLLVPGVGTQGGDLESVLKSANLKKEGAGGLLVNVTRSLIYASSGIDYQKKVREKALELQKAMSSYFI